MKIAQIVGTNNAWNNNSWVHMDKCFVRVFIKKPGQAFSSVSQSVPQAPGGCQSSVMVCINIVYLAEAREYT